MTLTEWDCTARESIPSRGQHKSLCFLNYEAEKKRVICSFYLLRTPRKLLVLRFQKMQNHPLERHSSNTPFAEKIDSGGVKSPPLSASFLETNLVLL